MLGWIDGITAAMVVLCGIGFGFYFLYQSKKKGARLLKHLFFITIFAGLLYLGVFLDFIYFLLTETNLSEPPGLVAVISYIFFPPIMVSAIYVGAEIEFPDKKWHLVRTYIVGSIFFYIMIFTFPLESFHIGSYALAGEDGLIDYNIELISPAGIVLILMLLPVVVAVGIGAMINSGKSSGIIKKQFFWLGCGAFCYGVFGMMEGLIQPGPLVVIVRIGYLASFWFMYVGLSTGIK